jgi:hypothetical protein
MPASLSKKAALVAVVTAFCALPSAYSYQDFQEEIPNGDVVFDYNGVAWPGVGHNRRGGGGSRNQFGKDFAVQGNKWTNALCNMDSDGDGVSNGVELGDPDCVWGKGDTPKYSNNITHPAFAPKESTGLDDTLTGAPQWVEAHGFMMTAAWLVCIPVAIAFAVVFKNKTESSVNWFFYHRTFVGIGLGMVLVAFILAVNNTPSSHFSSTHGKLGLTTVIVAFLQGLSGALRPHKEEGSRARALWEPVHWWTGRSVVLLAAGAMYTGYDDNLSLYTETGSTLGVVVLVLIGMFAAAYIGHKLLIPPTSESDSDAQLKTKV